MAQVEFFEDAEGTRPLPKDWGSAIIGKTAKTVYMRNNGPYPLMNVWLQITPTRVAGNYSYDSFKFLEIDAEVGVGQIVPAIIWQPKAGSDECTFEGNIVVHAIERKDWMSTEDT